METYKLSKNANKLFFITLFVVFAFALSSCGGGSKMSKSDKSQESNQVEVSGLTSNHGLQTGEFSVEPGASEERGNVGVSCPADGSACVVTVAEDGSVVYDKTGGMPTFMSVLAALMAPLGHGLSAGEFSVEPGASEERGNVGVSCPADGSACVVTVAEDGSVVYDKTGGMPTFMSALAALMAPLGHGLSAGEFSVEPGASEELGNGAVSCPADGSACVVTVAEDGSVVYDKTGGMPTFMFASSLGVVEIRPGLSRSLQEPVYSTSDDDNGLEQSLPIPENVFAPISTALDRVYGDQNIVRSSDTAFKAISSDGDNGFFVTFVDGGEEWTTHYTKDEFIDDDEYYEKEFAQNGYSLFWSYTDSFSGTYRNRGSSEYTYFDINGGIAGSPEEDVWPRFLVVYGARTEADNLPVGTSTYQGRIYAEVWVGTHFIDDRTSVRGRLLLTADFDASMVDGEITNIAIEPRSTRVSSFLPDNRFVIENGEIENGQFIATLRGEDSSGPADVEETNVLSSVQGIEGNVLGEFYGPQADEVGAVLNAGRGDEENFVMFGYLSGKQFTDTLNPTVPEGKLSEPLFATIKRDFGENMSATLTDETGVKSIQSDEERGFVLTYVVDGGEPQEVHLQASDFDHVDGSYFKRTELGEYYLWTETDFIESVEFEYFDPYGFVFGHGDGVWPWSVFVSGVQTDLDDLPSGTATYQGLMQAYAWKGPDRRSQRTRIRGSLNLTADFGESTVQGRVDNVNLNRPGDNEYLPLSDTDQFVIENSVFENNQFTADLRGEDSNALAPLDESVRGIEGSIVGQFFGPAAEEVGGILKATRTEDNSEVKGWFGGDRE